MLQVRPNVKSIRKGAVFPINCTRFSKEQIGIAYDRLVDHELGPFQPPAG